MRDNERPRKSRQTIPILIAAAALIAALGAIVAALRPSTSEPSTTATETRRLGPEIAKRGTPSRPVPARGADQDGPRLSKDLAGPLKAAHDALNAKRYEDAISKLKEVEALPNRTPFDTHIMNELFGVAYVRTNNYVEAAKYLEPGVTDGFLKPKDLNTRIKALAQVNYQVKNYDKAIEFGNRAIGAEPTDTLTHTLVAQAYYLKGDWRGASRFEEEFVRSQIETGGAPEETSLQLLLGACLKLGDTACEMRALDKLVTYYPKTEYQRELDRLRAVQ